MGFQDALSGAALPEHSEQVAEMVTDQDLAESVVCGPDPERHNEQISEFEAAGYVHQVGPHQQGFLDFYSSEILPEFD